MAKRKRKRTNVETIPPSDPPVRPGIVGLSRIVPDHITKPPYAATGEPGPSTSALVRTPAELEAMRRAGALAAEVLIHAGGSVGPGVTTDKLDEIVHNEIIRRGAYPSPLNYRRFRKSVCTSMLMMSPSRSTVLSGMPWQMTSLTDVQTDLRKRR